MTSEKIKYYKLFHNRFDIGSELNFNFNFNNELFIFRNLCTYLGLYNVHTPDPPDSYPFLTI